MTPSHPFGCLVLAAGGSTRLGRPKQLLDFGGRTLLARVVAAALGSVCRPVTVVLGHAAESCRAQLAAFPAAPDQPPGLRWVVNERWAAGQGSSLKCGLAALLGPGFAASGPPGDAPPGVVVVLGDQPLVSAADLDRLVATQLSTGAPVVAAEYAGSAGVPALFTRTLFAELAALPDDAGAKSLLRRDPARVTRVPLPAAAVDVDTPADYARWHRALVSGPAAVSGELPPGPSNPG